ncbi:substrate-binding periplasmic protein [Dethiosulfovibrio salsuginis]|uniref:Amino acid ABC transporter substrate-binding protein, PAAT family n=1 Tax=Dethiosulfovibrio salsuginis TaxID=561720 RepID=A0A1X7LAI7_9BACT|nr:transporter substrate-binding domain-containing protein [Dethiosulfovibrio salsuginis]SMG50567.1 amino acid ABC transporter substrate-binding protein, PAAT family [Dethiosulfovibrio salsuginis]
MKRVFVLALLSLVFVASSCWGADKVVTAVGDPWPPFGDPEKQSKGLAVEIAEAAMKTQGYRFEMSFMPWARAEDGVKKGTYDFLLYVWVTEARKSTMFYSEPYGENRLVFIKPKGSNFEYNGVGSLKGLTVGVVRDYGYGDEFMNAKGFNREAAPDFMTNAKKLAAGRIDLTVEDEVVASSLLMGTDLADKIAFTENALSVEPLHVTSGLANPRHKELIEAFNRGLEEIKKDGTYDLILGHYGLK